MTKGKSLEEQLSAIEPKSEKSLENKVSRPSIFKKVSKAIGNAVDASFDLAVYLGAAAGGAYLLNEYAKAHPFVHGTSGTAMDTVGFQVGFASCIFGYATSIVSHHIVEIKERVLGRDDAENYPAHHIANSLVSSALPAAVSIVGGLIGFSALKEQGLIAGVVIGSLLVAYPARKIYKEFSW